VSLAARVLRGVVYALRTQLSISQAAQKKRGEMTKANKELMKSKAKVKVCLIN
jgi:hypothetical protein